MKRGKPPISPGLFGAASLQLKVFCPGMDITVHFRGPLQEAPKAGALVPKEFPKLKKPDLRHLDASVSFDTP
jgi:hypothetical protein